ncbi:MULTISPECIES: galactose/methyl galactoside ABC transporter permease MglC [Bacillaceae]|uniref:Beta-methylgalactoside transporter n=2 Tax=Bacillus infantis TaxID=324767 RepID=U5LH13_9BACI|nr:MULTISPECIES: galactose/methyl galactoside ABC transporter permease MglC [Bacillus]OXT15629.1 galactoside ABC transporter permease MglC [Bacillus sp. OG2]AGX06708.1 beta-methylgalactoside transporter [Bacillus infantis NRRL B-14911]EAR67619.1 beta-methylgalactoside transporter inner membrane component [Bacillus sp. NRRL B-14911]MCA1033279.1 galactose/methyl galactoside ABC transporter permease MglC [Bacillus infantis]MCK6206805.1 galactose/methyl galactoside ABC transporter permease MglC [B
MNKAEKRFDAAKWLVDNVIYVVLVLLVIGIIIASPDFLSITNFINILSQSSSRIIIALGVAGILITAGTDLSAGRLVGLAAVVSASMLQASDYAYKMYPNLAELPIIVPILIAMAVTGLFGALNGVIVSKFHVPPFIATLGMMIGVYGVTSIYFDRPPYGAQPIGGLSQSFTTFAQRGIPIGQYELPYLVIYAAIVSIIIWVIWNKTQLGKNMYAIGGNPEAAKVSGVNVARNIILIYLIAGLLYGFSGTLEAGRVGSATNNTGNMYELDAIAACVVGGVSLSGGIGTVPGVITGVLIFQIINYGLAFLGVSPYIQFIVKGAIIIVAVAFDMRKHAKKK